MMIIFRISLLFSLFSTFLMGQGVDTALIYMQSAPYALNIIQGNGDIYVGTSEGVFKVEGVQLQKVDSRPGYAIFDKEVEVTTEVAFTSPIYFRNLSFLPEEFKSANVQMIRRHSLIYLVAAGSFFVYELRPYSAEFRGYSVRSISENFVAAYGGVFKNGSNYPYLSYSSGRIYEYGDTVIACYDGLFVQTPDTFIYRVNAISAQYSSNLNLYGHAREYMQSADGARVLFTTDGVYFLNDAYEVEDVIFREPINVRRINERWLEPRYFGSNEGHILFSYDNKIYRYNVLERSYTDSLLIPGKINTGTLKKNTFHCWVSSSAGLFFVNNFSTFRKISEESNFHTLLLDEYQLQWLFCSSNLGLDVYDLRSGVMYDIIDGVEFNQFGLYRKSDNIYAGAIDGVYKIPRDQIEASIALNLEKKIAEQLEDGVLQQPESFVFIGLAGISVVLMYLVLFRKKSSEDLPIRGLKPMADIRTRVIDYVEDNMANASIESVCKHFEFSSSKLYAITSPEKPGELIRRIRFERVKQMREAGYTKNEIANATGFSISYISRIK